MRRVAVSVLDKEERRRDIVFQSFTSIYWHSAESVNSTIGIFKKRREQGTKLGKFYLLSLVFFSDFR